MKVKGWDIKATQSCFVFQTGLQVRQERSVLRHLKPASKEDLEKIKFVHIILPLCLLVLGWTISTLQFMIEKFC